MVQFLFPQFRLLDLSFGSNDLASGQDTYNRKVKDKDGITVKLQSFDWLIKVLHYYYRRNYSKFEYILL